MSHLMDNIGRMQPKDIDQKVEECSNHKISQGAVRRERGPPRETTQYYKKNGFLVYSQKDILYQQQQLSHRKTQMMKLTTLN